MSKIDLFRELLPSLNQDKVHILDAEREKEYPAFIVNRAYSMGIGTVLHANEMNRLHELPNRMQYDYYFHVLRQQKRFDKWAKADKDNEDVLSDIMWYYDVSRGKAKEILRVLDQKSLDAIRQKAYKGGRG